ncbi:MAG TPA: DUF4352 domain-containing protein [Pseudobacteroides sp.]|uniref:DUF4352 domain-containing protein n=1 Tax=Pseudobacteroides sp. TaxID=1968840 RepID=UPI002F91E441
MRKFIMVILMILIVTASTACDSKITEVPSSLAASSTTPQNVASTTANSKNTQKSETSKGTQHVWVKVGKSVSFQNVIYTVNAIKKSKGKLFSAKNGNVYYTIDMTIKNNSKEEMAVSSILLFALYDSKGKIFNISVGGLVEMEEDQLEQLDGSIAVKGEMRGGLAYEIPEKAKGLKLDVKTLLGNDKVTFNLDE